jgi:hypothetical protein
MRNLWPGFFISSKREKRGLLAWCGVHGKTRSDPCAAENICDRRFQIGSVDVILLIYDLGRKRKVGLLNAETQWLAPTNDLIERRRLLLHPVH